MTEKHTDNSKYKDSQTKTHKRLQKHLTRRTVSDTIFSNRRHKRAICTMHPEHTQISSTNNTHRTRALSSCVFYITPFKETATPAENAKDYKRMSYKASLKTSCVLGVLSG